METTERLVESITKGIQEKKGRGIVIADLKEIDGAICRYFVVCQGNSPQQVEAIAEAIGDSARTELQEKPVNVVGMEQSSWVAMDYVDVMVHIFLPEARTFYDIENLWEDARLTHVVDLD